jgi:hypothetical protein
MRSVVWHGVLFCSHGVQPSGRPSQRSEGSAVLLTCDCSDATSEAVFATRCAGSSRRDVRVRRKVRRWLAEGAMRNCSWHDPSPGRAFLRFGVVSVSHTYLASVARLSGALRVCKLPLHRGREVVVAAVRHWLRRARRHAMLDALDLVDELRVVLRGPLGGHDAVVATGGGIFREANNRWHGRGRLVA